MGEPVTEGLKLFFRGEVNDCWIKFVERIHSGGFGEAGFCRIVNVAGYLFARPEVTICYSPGASIQ